MPVFTTNGYTDCSMNGHGKPLIVQGDGSLLLDVHEDSFDSARGEISAFAELEKSPEHMHTYRVTPLSLWNAAGAGWTGDDIAIALERWSRYPVPTNVTANARDILSRWGQLRLKVDEEDERRLLMEVDDPAITQELKSRKALSKWLKPVPGGFA